MQKRHLINPVEDTEISPKQRRNSRPLDVHRWSNHSEVNKFVEQLWDVYLDEEFPNKNEGVGKRPKASAYKQFKVLLLDFYVAWYEDPELMIGIPQSPGAYKANSRYNKLFISKKVIEISKSLVRLGLLNRRKGSEQSKQTSRFWPTDKLIEHFKDAKFSYLDIGVYEHREVIILNKGKDGEDELDDKKEIQYEDEDFPGIPEMRREVEAYNELLHQSFIDIATLDQPWVVRDFYDTGLRAWRQQKVRIGHPNKFVRRIFYRGDWNLGGRFHGGFWQLIGEEYRKDILINDEATIEQDFSGLHVNFCYALKELPPLEEDPYFLELLLHPDQKVQRAWTKVLSLMALNASSAKQAYKAFRHKMMEKAKSKRAKGLNDVPEHQASQLRDNQLENLLEAFKEKHYLIEDMICTDQGVKLMNIDGKITSRVINHFTKKRKPILTVHDSYITPQDQTGELRTAMTEAVKAELNGYVIKIDQDGIGMDQIRAFQSMERWNPHWNDYFKSLKRPKRTEGYRYRYEQYQKWLEQQD
ncbi:MAG: hypothetical protein HOL98_10485 [Gammaproteobacteria bacterium]|nr:hypothetical protein [Gammaproteobacteria bacterium]